MALLMEVETSHGLIIKNAYVRIDEQSGNKNLISVRVRFYASKKKADAGHAWVQEVLHDFAPSTENGSSNFIRQGYKYLKTLEEYQYAVDV